MRLVNSEITVDVNLLVILPWVLCSILCCCFAFFYGRYTILASTVSSLHNKGSKGESDVSSAFLSKQQTKKEPSSHSSSASHATSSSVLDATATDPTSASSLPQSSSPPRLSSSSQHASSSSLSTSNSTNNLRRRTYRFEEEGKKRMSSEYTRRGQLWSTHASWQLPTAPRSKGKVYGNADGTSSYANFTSLDSQGLEHVRAILATYDVDLDRGFLPKDDPLQRLPYARYHIWEDLADDLPKLLGARLGQAREPLRQLPVLGTDKLTTYAELRRAHLLLCLFAHAYVWGGNTHNDEIPEGVAKPLWDVSERLGIPPVLGHPSIVLYNWRRLDAEGAISMENLSTLNNFFDGRDESWFYLITVEVEARGAAAVVPMMLSIDAINRYHDEQKENTYRRRKASSISKSASDDMDDSSYHQQSLYNNTDERYLLSRDEDDDDDDAFDGALIGELTTYRVASFVTKQLKKIADAVRGMCESLSCMREGCHPFIFYHRVRPFLSGWKHNPTLPNGVLYTGVSDVRQMFYGGSAAQSALIPFLDIGLGISHDSIKSQEFLLAMRDYMIKPHREFLTYLESVACIRPFVVNCLSLCGMEIATSSSSEGSAENGVSGGAGEGEKPVPAPAATNNGGLGSRGALYVSNSVTSVPRNIMEDLRDAYDDCVQQLRKFRTGHIALVAEYIIAQQRKGVSKDALEGSAGGKGTGGTDLMNFLKPIRDNCAESLLTCPAPKPPKVDAEDTKKTYSKNEGNFEDIDIFRGAAFQRSNDKLHYPLPLEGPWNEIFKGQQTSKE